MIDVTDQWWIALYFAIPCGLIGGFAYELLLTRRSGQTGQVEMPGSGRGRLRDLGFIASMILGSIAATAFLLAYPPTETEVVRSGMTSTTRAYSALGLISVSLVVGAAGSSILSAMTKAFTKAAESVKLDTILSGLKDVKESLESNGAEVSTLDTQGRSEVVGSVSVLITQLEDSLTD